LTQIGLLEKLGVFLNNFFDLKDKSIVDSNLESIDTFVPLGLLVLGTTFLILFGELKTLENNPLFSIELSICVIIRSTSSRFSTGKILVKEVRINLPAHVDLKAYKSSLANDNEGEPFGPDFRLTLQLTEKGRIGFNLKTLLKCLADFSIS
jgi:hypothetical protein